MADEHKTDNNTEPQKIEFNDAQQAHIEALIGKRIGTVKSKYETQVSELTQQVDELKASLAKKAKGGNDSGDQNVNADQIAEMKIAAQHAALEIKQLKQELQKANAALDTEKQKVLDIRKEAVIMAAAGKQNFYDPTEVAELTKKFIQWNSEEGKFIVVNENGTPRFNAALDQMSPEEFYTQYAATKKHLVRGDIRPGTGSSESQRSAGATTVELTEIFGPKSNSTKAMRLKKDNPDLYQRMRATAQREGLI